MAGTRVGVIGVGHLGQHHARVFSEIRNVDLVGVVDIDPVRAELVASRCGALPYQSYSEFFDKCKPDAISIAVPTFSHFEVAKEAIERGMHILVEKPVTSTMDEAEDLLLLAKHKGSVFRVGHVERFNAAIEYLRGRITQPLFMQSRRMGPFTPRVVDVGVVLDLMIHDIDIIQYLVGSEVCEISAHGQRVYTNHEDISTAHLTFKNGCMAHIMVSRVAEKRIRQLDITQKENFISVDYESQEISTHRFNRDNCGLVELVERPLIPKKEPLKLELEHFIKCVREGLQPMVGIEDGKRALEIAVEVLHQIQLPSGYVLQEARRNENSERIIAYAS